MSIVHVSSHSMLLLYFIVEEFQSAAHSHNAPTSQLTGAFSASSLSASAHSSHQTHEIIKKKRKLSPSPTSIDYYNSSSSSNLQSSTPSSSKKRRHGSNVPGGNYSKHASSSNMGSSRKVKKEVCEHLFFYQV